MIAIGVDNGLAMEPMPTYHYYGWDTHELYYTASIIPISLLLLSHYIVSSLSFFSSSM